MLKLQYFGHLMWRADSLEKTLMLGKIEGRKRRGWQRMWWLNGIIDSTDTSLRKHWETVKDGETLHAALKCCSPSGHKQLDMTEQLNNNRQELPHISSPSSGGIIYIYPCPSPHSLRKMEEVSILFQQTLDTISRWSPPWPYYNNYLTP